MENNYKYDVFISYSRKDTAIANKICQAFDKNGITYFIDRQGIGGGLEFPAVLARGIRESKVFLFLASKNSYESKFTQSEIVYAFNKKQKQDIIPYIIDGSSFPDELEFTFSAINWRRMDNHPIDTVLIKDIIDRVGKKTDADNNTSNLTNNQSLLPKVDYKQKCTELISYLTCRKFSVAILAISVFILFYSFFSNPHSAFDVLALLFLFILLIIMIVGLFRPSIVHLKNRKEVFKYYLFSILTILISLIICFGKEKDEIYYNMLNETVVDSINSSVADSINIFAD